MIRAAYRTEWTTATVVYQVLSNRMKQEVSVDHD